MAGGLGWRRPVVPRQGGGGVGLFSGQQVERLVIAALREVTLDEAMDRAGNLTEQPGDIVVPRRRQRMKLRAGGEDAVGEHGVGVAVEVEQRAEALHEGDGTRVGGVRQRAAAARRTAKRCTSA